jgi:thiosulfate reductase/polysulfide reductase chain A
MCAVRCPIEVTVQDGRVTWLQGNPHDKTIGTSLCAKGAAGLSLEFDDQRPQAPLIRAGPRGGGQWRRASWDEALDYVAAGLKETIEASGARGVLRTAARRSSHYQCHGAATVKPPAARKGSTARVPARLRRPNSQQGHGGKS